MARLTYSHRMLSTPVSDDFLEARAAVQHLCSVKGLYRTSGRGRERHARLVLPDDALAAVQMQSRPRGRWHGNTNKQATRDWLAWWGRPHNVVSSCGPPCVVQRAVWIMLSSRGDSGRSQISVGCAERRGEAWNPKLLFLPSTCILNSHVKCLDKAFIGRNLFSMSLGDTIGRAQMQATVYRPFPHPHVVCTRCSYLYVLACSKTVSCTHWIS